jgi:hypothetical protein
MKTSPAISKLTASIIIRFRACTTLAEYRALCASVAGMTGIVRNAVRPTMYAVGSALFFAFQASTLGAFWDRLDLVADAGKPAAQGATIPASDPVSVARLAVHAAQRACSDAIECRESAYVREVAAMRLARAQDALAELVG